MLLGIDLLDKHIKFFDGKRVGLITNHTGRDSNNNQTIDILNKKVNLVCLFAPEHGIRGILDAGEEFDCSIDQKTGKKIYSLYTSSRRLTKEMLDCVDVVAIDIQDVGSRFYTYASTMAYAMEECAKYNKEFVVFDRPNPLADIVDGNILDEEYRSFVGYFKVPTRHGMTLGELALMFNQEEHIGCKLIVFKMEGYNPHLYLDEYCNTFVSPSPAIKNMDICLLYNSTCLFEGTNISEGRGTNEPFKNIGAPFIKKEELAKTMNALNLKGVRFDAIDFVPTSSKYKGKLCHGIKIEVVDRKLFSSQEVGMSLLYIIRKLYKDDFKVLSPSNDKDKCMLDKLTGTNIVSCELLGLDDLLNKIKEDSLTFSKMKEKYLLYK